ncbi:BMC domain-containing protein [Vagococcus fluvialis]|uniref:BMC domain-containing protein n=1 Tax=Vagococcus fluvialis TaxID=2738 RepID=UPI001D0B4497|nr:BMC domain-containing protein [Vagococcus fluvialis]UDM71567.1 BMC domain-containing protein [Vagococcus fluvialis]UDM76428.1 BMC domain-containing protein [Vagococcus fluvialis]UDM83258.1 BMC domain-containing protein [Vagococcus fluvialis]
MKKSIGILETKGLTVAIEAADAMLKAANVTALGKEKIGSGLVTILIEGDVSAVEAAISVGVEVVKKNGELIGQQIIASPHEELKYFLP